MVLSSFGSHINAGKDNKTHILAPVSPGSSSILSVPSSSRQHVIRFPTLRLEPICSNLRLTVTNSEVLVTSHFIVLSLDLSTTIIMLSSDLELIGPELSIEVPAMIGFQTGIYSRIWGSLFG